MTRKTLVNTVFVLLNSRGLGGDGERERESYAEEFERDLERAITTQ